MSYHRFVISGLLPSVLWACAASTPPYANPVSPGPAQTLPPPAAAPASFADWKADFRTRAIAQGMMPATVDRLLASAQESAAVMQQDRKQPEFSKMIWSYLDGALAAQRIADGKRHFQRESALLQGLQQRFGVPAEIIAAIWGMETSYGAVTGSSHLPSALATLAYEGRRREFAEKQLLALMQLLDSGDVRWDQLSGSWAGGMGQTQFIPTTYRDNAVDGNGDGVRNLWDRADALASAANYLSRSGWQAGLPWGYEVVLPQGFDFGALGQTLTFAQWQQYGLLLADGRRLPNSAAQARLWLPAGYQGPAFLLTGNFDVIRVYNNSSSYALAIGLLGDAIAGKRALQGTWPRHIQPLSRTQITRLQTRLSAQGFDTQGTDGVLGEKTREAFRRWQAANGQIADGFVSAESAAALIGEY